MRKLISFTDMEIQKLENVKQNEGLRSVSEAVRACVRQWYDHKYFTKYGGKVTEPPIEVTPEQNCEMLGGSVIVKDDKNLCQLHDGATVWTVPMSLMGTGNYKVKDKNVIVKFK